MDKSKIEGPAGCLLAILILAGIGFLSLCGAIIDLVRT